MPIDPGKLYDDLDIALRVAGHVLAFMEEHGVSQNEVARRAGVGSGRLSRYMKGGRKEVPVSLVMRIADAIESSPSRILRELPPGRFYEQAQLRAAAPPQEGARPPRPASPSSARTGRRGAGGRG